MTMRRLDSVRKLVVPISVVMASANAAGFALGVLTFEEATVFILAFGVISLAGGDV